MLNEYVLKGEQVCGHSLFNHKDGQVVCGVELSYCHFDGDVKRFTGWLN